MPQARQKTVRGVDGRVKMRYVDGSANLTGRPLAREAAAAGADFVAEPGVLAPGRLEARETPAPAGAAFESALAVGACAQRLVDAVGGRAFFRLERCSRKALKTVRSKALACDLSLARFFGETCRAPELDVDAVRAFRRTHPRAALVGCRAARRRVATWDDARALADALPECATLVLRESRLEGALHGRAARSLRRLTALDCSGTDVGGTLEPFAALTRLEALDLSQCPKLSGPLAPLVALTNLRRLGLRYAAALGGRVDGPVLAWLSRLARRGGAARLRGSGPFRFLDDDPADALDVSGVPELRLGGCELAGSLRPLGAPRLAALRVLDVADCRGLRGALLALRGLRALEELVVAGCAGLAGPLDGLDKFAELRVFDARNCAGLEGPLEPLASCAKLATLVVAGCRKLRGPLGAGALAVVAGCDVLDGAGSGPHGAPRGGLRGLRRAAFGNVVLRGDLGNLVDDGVEELALCCDHVAGDLEPLRRAPRLARVRLENAWHLRRSLEPLRALDHLETLTLRGCKNLSGTLRGVARPSLRALEVSGFHDASGDLSDVFADGPAPSLAVLVLDGAARVSGGLEALARCAALEVLSLGGCANLEGPLAPLASLAKLRALRLGGCARLAGDLAPLAACAHLAELDVSRCAFAGPLDPLGDLPRLRVVDVSGAAEAPVLGLRGALPPRLVARAARLDVSHCPGLEDVLAAAASRAPGVVVVEPERAGREREAAAAAGRAEASAQRDAAAARDRADATRRRERVREADAARDAREREEAEAARKREADARRAEEERTIGAEVMADYHAAREAGSY